MNIRTQDVSGWSGKGQHTTTFAEMYDLPFGGKLMDTPGMKEFGMMGVEKGELSGYFPEMRERMRDCQFNNLPACRRTRMCCQTGCGRWRDFRR